MKTASRFFAALVVLAAGLAGGAGAQPSEDTLVCCVASELSPPCEVVSFEDCVGGVGAPLPGEICCALPPIADTCTGTSCDTGLPGACANGTAECVDGSVACVPPSAPEVCDGEDNDCDGETDEGFTLGEACDGPDADACLEGATVCDGMGGVVCGDSTSDNVEVCNGIDDDCNGTADDGTVDSGQPCGSGVGACTPGVTDCQNGALVCAGEVGPTSETCNGIDDDCNGMVDEGAASSCPIPPNSSPTCQGGTCGFSCNGSFRDCDGNAVTGCEVSVNSNVNHCGACNNVCEPRPNSFPVCSNATCTLICQAGFRDCDGSIANGCEVAGNSCS